MVSERIGRGFASLDALRYYFCVNNSYVKNKLKLILFPFTHNNWKRDICVSGDEMEVLAFFVLPLFLANSV